MKKLVFGLFVIAAMSANAQIESGKLFIGGSVGFGTNGGSSEASTGGTTVTKDSPSTFGFNFIPQAGFMITENLAVGGGIGYDYSKTTWIESHTDNTGKSGDYEMYSKSGSFIFAPFARFYKNTGDKVYAFGEFAMPLSFGTRQTNSWDSSIPAIVIDDPTKLMSFGVNLSIGFNYFLNDKCALEAKWAAIQFNSEKETTTGANWEKVDKYNSFGLGFDLTAITVGLRIFI